jgi:hypothetical protein
MNIIAAAFNMARVVESFVEKAKKFFYSVMLLGHRCPRCNGSLIMMPESRCRCTSCGNQFDPTIEFQRCSACGGVPVLKIRRYKCKKCHSEIRSNFLFDGSIFNAEYFRQKVAESRERKKQQKERIKQILAECRSNDLQLGVADLTSIPGLLDALNSLTAGKDSTYAIESRDEFDLKRYEEHLKTHIQDFPLTLGEIPPLSRKSARKDLIWRFIAAIFLDHAAVVDVWQDGQDIMVIKHEVNRKRQDILGELEEADGIERPVGGVETW